MGNPLVLMLTGGEVHDSTMKQPVLDQLEIEGSFLLGDKAYGAEHNREYLTNYGAQYCIPPKTNCSKPWKCDYWHYKERHLVECFFMRIKDYRRVAMRFDKLARRYLGMVYLAACLVWIA